MRLLSLTLLLGLAVPAAAQTYSGSLDDGDATRDFGELYDPYTFEAQEGQQVTVRMEGTEGLDTYLVVRSPSGMEWTNDDFEGVNVSQVNLVAGEAGEWEVRASAFSGEGRGPYSLDISLGGIARVTTIAGRLDPSDPQTIKGEHFDTFTIEAPESGTFTVELLCYGFDGYLRVTAPNGRMWRNDDAGETTISRVENLPGMPGTWTVDVTTVGEGAVGAYDLRVLVFD